MGRLIRLENWPVRLDAAIEAARGRPFKWGEHDCATWASEVVCAITGARYWFAASYGSEKDADREIERLGLDSLAAGVSRVLEPLESPLLAQRGDIVQHKIGALGVCVGSMAMCLRERGLIAVPVKNCVRAWRV